MAIQSRNKREGIYWGRRRGKHWRHGLSHAKPLVLAMTLEYRGKFYPAVRQDDGTFVFLEHPPIGNGEQFKLKLEKS